MTLLETKVDQDEYFGPGTLSHLETVLDRIKPRSIFLVGNSAYAKSGAEAIMNPLLQRYKVTRFQGFTENPKLKEIEAGLAHYPNDTDLVIAVGGGSAIDSAKLINVLAAHRREGTPLELVKGRIEITVPGAPLIAIPTTAGSGSETTQYIVIYVEKTKYSVAHPHIIPTAAIIDPVLTASLPRPAAASACFDALSQAVEAYWSKNSTTESKAYSRTAITLAVEHLTAAVNSQHLESRIAMAQAANLAGKAINIAKTTGAHAFAYAMSSYYGIAHGHAVGLNLGPMLVYNSEVTEQDCNDPRGTAYVKNTIAEICSWFGCAEPSEAQRYLHDLMDRIGLETDLTKLDLGPAQLENLSFNVNHQRLNNNPRRFSKNTTYLEIMTRTLDDHRVNF